MTTVFEAIDAAIAETRKARAVVSRLEGRQVRSADSIAMLKSIANGWFRTHRPTISSGVPDVDLSVADREYTIVLNSTAKSAARTTYLDALKAAKDALVTLRAAIIIAPKTIPSNSDDVPPDFSPLTGNQEMREILVRRWQECVKCVRADAHLAAIVMMGGLLEALFVARANKMVDKRPLIEATSAPKDKATGKTVNYQEWMLDSYIKVGRELNWITDSAMDVADILKEYRNYVHPEKERRHGVVLQFNDSSMFWEVTKALVRQLLLSTRTA